jgi:hypothetical protein
VREKKGKTMEGDDAGKEGKEIVIKWRRRILRKKEWKEGRISTKEGGIKEW